MNWELFLVVIILVTLCTGAVITAIEIVRYIREDIKGKVNKRNEVKS